MPRRMCIAVLFFALLAVVYCSEKPDASRAPPMTAGTGNNVNHPFAKNPSAKKTEVKQQLGTKKKPESHIQQADDEPATWTERPARAHYEPDAGSDEPAQNSYPSKSPESLHDAWNKIYSPHGSYTPPSDDTKDTVYSPNIPSDDDTKDDTKEAPYKPYQPSDDDRKPYAPYKPYRPYEGERKSYAPYRPYGPSYGGQRKPYGPYRPYQQYGPYRPYQPSYGAQRKPYAPYRPYQQYEAEDKPYAPYRPYQQYEGERKPYAPYRPYQPYRPNKPTTDYSEPREPYRPQEVDYKPYTPYKPSKPYYPEPQEPRYEPYQPEAPYKPAESYEPNRPYQPEKPETYEPNYSRRSADADYQQGAEGWQKDSRSDSDSSYRPDTGSDYAAEKPPADGKYPEGDKAEEKKKETTFNIALLEDSYEDISTGNANVTSYKSNFICPDFWRTHPEHCGAQDSRDTLNWQFLQDTMLPHDVGSCVFTFTKQGGDALPMCAFGCVDVDMSCTIFSTAAKCADCPLSHMVTFNATGFVGTFQAYSCQSSYAPAAKNAASRALSVTSSDEATYYKGIATMVEADVTSVTSSAYGDEITELLQSAKIYYIGGIAPTDGAPIWLEDDPWVADELPFVTGGSFKIVMKKKQY